MYQLSKSLKRELGIPKVGNVTKWAWGQKRMEGFEGNLRKFVQHSAATWALAKKLNSCESFIYFKGITPNTNRSFIRGPPPPVERAKFRFISFLLTTSLAVIGTFLYNIYKVKIRYSRLLPENAGLLPLSESSEYIYICDPFVEAGIWQTQLLPWLPYLKDPSYTVAWRLLQDTKSDDVEKRRNAVAMLSKMNLEDSLYRQIAQMVEFETGVGLAHSNADPRLVDRNRSINLKGSNVNLGEKFRDILNNMPKGGIHQCVVDYSDEAIRAFLLADHELESITFETFTGFESEQIGAKYKRKPREDQFLVPCLQAILSHSRLKENVLTLLQLKLVDALMMVVEKYRGNREIMYLVVKIIANLTCHPNISSYFRDTGVLRLLAELAESVDLKFSMPARRALHNLDREYSTPILPPGIYQLYPDFRFDETQLDIDIVFVHGLLGGAFRTWRREDKKSVLRVTMKPGDPPKPSKMKAWFEGFTPLSKGDPNYDKTKPEKTVVGKDHGSACRIWTDGQWIVTNDCHCVEYETRSSGASQCWPRDWLPKDVENARILAVDFDSFVTHWTKVCPVENIGRTLFDRSSELLEKLASAGIGSRPIIWVTHSMGGLLVKQLLTLASSSKNENNKAVAAQTRGMLFCSVPHIGSNVASRSSAGAALLLMPTQEVKELSYGSEELKTLNENFSKLRQQMRYKVISFGETKDVIVSSLGVKLQLVPLSSADPGYGDFYTLDVDHLNICKVPSRGAFVYRKLVELVENARNNPNVADGLEEAPAPILFPPTDPKAKKKKVVERDNNNNNNNNYSKISNNRDNNNK